MSEYVPTTEVVKDACTFPRRRLGEPRNMTPAAFDRFIASVKAEALREAAHMLDVAPATDTRDSLEAEVRQIRRLRARADEIEEATP